MLGWICSGINTESTTLHRIHWQTKCSRTEIAISIAEPQTKIVFTQDSVSDLTALVEATLARHLQLGFCMARRDLVWKVWMMRIF
jgi:hypothetical protein